MKFEQTPLLHAADSSLCMLTSSSHFLSLAASSVGPDGAYKIRQGDQQNRSVTTAVVANEEAKMTGAENRCSLQRFVHAHNLALEDMYQRHADTY